jgi:hypothetical protein
MEQGMTRVRFGPVQIGIIVLTVATAIIHLVLAVPETLIMFYLNGLGYLALVAALYLPAGRPYRRYIRFALMAFTAVTILGWAVMGERSPIGFIDKAIEILLLVLLWLEHRQQNA